jgi:hypothetical protein
MKTYLGIGLLAASMALIAVWSTAGLAKNRTTPAGQTASHFVDRLLLNPGLNQALVIGYFSDVEGISDPIFSGAPSEATAFFTFSLRAHATGLVVNGDTSVAFLGSDESLNVYFNATPDQSWDNGASFSAGQLVASLRSEPGAQISTGPISLVSQSYVLVFSQDFVFNGTTYNFKQLTPYGFTSTVLASNIPLAGAGTPDFPLVFTGAGSNVAIGVH